MAQPDQIIASDTLGDKTRQSADQPTVHDARTGFHDIKSPPGFHPPASTAWWPAAAALSVLMLIAFLRRKKTKTAAPVSSTPPLERALMSLDELERLWSERKLRKREYALQLSQIIREYLQQSLSFPALEQTGHELDSSFPGVLKNRLPWLSRESLESSRDKLRRAMRFSERVAFASDALAPNAAAETDYPEALRQVRSLVQDLEKWLKHERERLENLVKDSKQKDAA